MPLIPPAPIPPRRPSTWRFLRSLRRDILSTFAEESYERLTIRGSILGKPFLLVNDPAGIRRVLVDNAFNYVKPPSTIRVVSPFTGNGLLLTEGDAWRGQRRRVAHAFTPSHVRALVPLFAAAAEDLVRRLEAGDPLDPDAFQAVALDAVLRALFSDATPELRVRSRWRRRRSCSRPCCAGTGSYPRKAGPRCRSRWSPSAPTGHMPSVWSGDEDRLSRRGSEHSVSCAQGQGSALAGRVRLAWFDSRLPRS